MAGRLDPPHDRVMLTPDEVRTVDRLERALAGQIVCDPADAGKESRPQGPRRRTFAGLRSVGFVPWLIPIAAVGTVVALSLSLVAGVLGTLLTGGALVVSFRWRRLRAPRRYGRSRRRRRRW